VATVPNPLASHATMSSVVTATEVLRIERPSDAEIMPTPKAADTSRRRPVRRRALAHEEHQRHVVHGGERDAVEQDDQEPADDARPPRERQAFLRS